MATVAIIHAAEDALPARALAEKLRLAKLTVILEKQGEDLRGLMKDAKVAIALWSPRSVDQASVVDDAMFARTRSKLVHASMQNVVAPSQFSGDPTVNLTGWRGEDDFAPWLDLAKLVTERAGVKPLPPPAPRPATGFFEPGAVRPEAHVARPGPAPMRPPAPPASQAAPRQPQQRAAPQPQRAAPPPRPQPAPRPAPAAASGDEPKRGGGAGLMIGIAAVVVLGLAGGGYYFYSQSQGASATSTAWEAVDQNSANALREFISGDPGDFRDDAQQALAALEERSFEAASDSDTIEALEAFLNDFPESEHAIVARGRIAELQTLQQSASEDETTGVLPPDATEPDGTLDPNDLAPPNATGSDTGPAPLTPPPATDESTTPDDAPTN